MYVTMVSTTIGDISYLRNERKSQGTYETFYHNGKIRYIYKISWPFYDICRRNQKDLPFS